MAFFTAAAIVLNATVIIVSLMYKQLRQPLNYALVNMAVADLGTAVTGGIPSMVNKAQGYFSLGRTGRVMEGFSVSLCGEWKVDALYYGHLIICNVHNDATKRYLSCSSLCSHYELC